MFHTHITRRIANLIAFAVTASLLPVIVNAAPADARPIGSAQGVPQSMATPDVGPNGWTWSDCLSTPYNTDPDLEGAAMYDHFIGSDQYRLKCGMATEQDGHITGYGLRKIQMKHNGTALLGPENFTKTHVKTCLTETFDHGRDIGPSSNNDLNDVWKYEGTDDFGNTLTSIIVVRRLDDSIVTAYPNMTVGDDPLENAWADCATWWSTQPGAHQQINNRDRSILAARRSGV